MTDPDMRGVVPPGGEQPVDDVPWTSATVEAAPARRDLPDVPGDVPAGTTAEGPPKRLEPGVTYYVYASDGDTYYGSFEIKRVLKVDSNPEAGRNGPYFNGNFPKQ